VDQLGIEEERLRLEWISAAEGDKLRDVTNAMVAEIRRLGPLKLEPIPRPNGEAETDTKVPEAIEV
jgi:F420-non-reducing hydrogenase iron-sulfur subunit